MKKLLALSMAAMMALGMTSTISAADETTKDVDTKKGEDSQSGEVWGSISKDTLKQLKVTLPIKVEFIISPAAGADDPNTLTVGDYKVVVPNDSEVGVQVNSITATPALDTPWNLVADATAVENDVHAYNLSIGGVTLKEGKNDLTNFTVEKNSSKLLDIKGSGSKAKINDPESAKKALDIVYTISQYTPAS